MTYQKRIAWDGVSFLIPGNWELALYKFLKKGVTRVEIEDEYTVRMEAEWVRPRRKLQMDHILERYEARSKKLTMRADRKKAVEQLPKGWVATRYTFAETVPNRGGKGLTVIKHDLVTAFYLCPESTLFCFVLFHFLPEDQEDPAKVARLVASEFRHHNDGQLVPWQLFDIAFETPREFLLENTQYGIGSKLMVFRWKLRRFYLWHFSCADMFLKEAGNIETWVAGYINDTRLVRGGSFYVDEGGEIRWKKRRRHVIAHRDQLARWCFRHKVSWHLDKEKNQLIVWAFNYRKPKDLDIIPDSLWLDNER